MDTAERNRSRTMRRAVVAACLSATMVQIAPADAGPNRCETEAPERAPTQTDEAGEHWFDEKGVWTQAPDGTMFGHGGVDLQGRSAEVDLWSNHSLQAHAGEDRQCVVVGTTGLGASDIGEFPIAPGADVVELPWLSRDGSVFRASDGRTTILRGVDWPYNQEIFEAPYNLTEEDFERIASWGMNLLRIRISSARSGFLPGTEAEPGYWENLDRLIAAANRHGIYVLPSTVTNDAEAMGTTAVHDQLKFLRGTSNHDRWMQYQRELFQRYRQWPGVVGFDPLNEDDSYPPYVHDRFFIGAQHGDANAALREDDRRHVYFQEPSGWSYWGAEWWPGMMQGHDVGDPNRVYCPKWKPGGSADEELDVKGRLAVESGVPMFICEMWIDHTDASTVAAWQRDAHHAMDRRLMGGVRVLYGPSAGYGTHSRDGTESHWVAEFARPYPTWVGGGIVSISYDYDLRRLVTDLDLDGSGPTEIYTSLSRTYPDGFEVTTSDGARLVHDGNAVVVAHGLSWDGDRDRVALAPRQGATTVTVTPLE